MSQDALSRRGLLTAAVSLSVSSTAGAVDIGATAGQTIPGWQEALLIVRDLEPWIETLTVVGGWEVAYRGLADAALNAFWALPTGARTEQVLMRNIGTRTGFVRLIKVTGVEQRPIRQDDQAWETGGVQALDIRVLDLETTQAALHARGWRAPSDPVRYTTYGFEVIQWAPSSPDGVRLSFIQRISPPLKGWADLKRWSRVANAAITVRDMAAAKTFFGAILGLKAISVSNTVGGDGPNVMGMPWSFARRAPVDIRGFSGGGDDGAIELISIPDAQGPDHADAAHPPNLGVAGLRFRVGDVQALKDRLALIGSIPTPAIQTAEFAPFGRRRAITVNAPDGVWLEFIEAP